MKFINCKAWLKLGVLMLLAAVAYYAVTDAIHRFLHVADLRTPWEVYQEQLARNEEIYQTQPTPRNKTCQKVKHLLFTKVEKTGSSTLASIFARFALDHMSNVMTTTYGGHLDITKRKGQVPGWNIGPRSNDKAEVLIDHARYNESFFQEHFVSDAKLITSVREAESWFQSAVGFWSSLIGKRTADRVLEDNMTYIPRTALNDQYNGMKTIYHLSQLQWLGFDYRNRANITAIQDYIDYIVPRYDVVVLTDQFDASLVLLRRRLCWEHSDIIYINKEKTKYYKSYLSAKNKRLLLSLEVNLGDQILYEAFNHSWWRQPEVNTNDFWDEVEYFKSLNQDHVSQCKRILKTNISYIYNATKWSKPLILDKTLCQSLTYPKYFLKEEVSKYALGSAYDSKRL